MTTLRNFPREPVMSELVEVSKAPETLVVELRQLISDERRQAAATVNIALTLLYWKIGHRIRRDIFGNERAGYGQLISCDAVARN